MTSARASPRGADERAVGVAIGGDEGVRESVRAPELLERERRGVVRARERGFDRLELDGVGGAGVIEDGDEASTRAAAHDGDVRSALLGVRHRGSLADVVAGVIVADAGRERALQARTTRGAGAEERGGGRAHQTGGERARGPRAGRERTKREPRVRRRGMMGRSRGARRAARARARGRRRRRTRRGSAEDGGRTHRRPRLGDDRGSGREDRGRERPSERLAKKTCRSHATRERTGSVACVRVAMGRDRAS